MAMTTALQRWSLGAYARVFPGYHQLRQTNFGMEAATTARLRIALVGVVVARWFKHLDAIFVMFRGFILVMNSSN
jgi:hypothetical protein